MFFLGQNFPTSDNINYKKLEKTYFIFFYNYYRLPLVVFDNKIKNYIILCQIFGNYNVDFFIYAWYNLYYEKFILL